jgi:ribose/xylose/arabinose/galactoside ABC-type transport system permease subunit
MLVCVIYYWTPILNIMPLSFWLFVVVVDILLFSITIGKQYSSLSPARKVLFIISFLIVAAVKVYFVINWINMDLKIG